MPESTSRDARQDRDDVERATDHAAIDRLTAELLPALIAKLGATGLGELEVREGGEGPYSVQLFLFWPNSGSQYPRCNLSPVVVSPAGR